MKIAANLFLKKHLMEILLRLVKERAGNFLIGDSYEGKQKGFAGRHR
jgi:hypothetical protein